MASQAEPACRLQVGRLEDEFLHNLVPQRFIRRVNPEDPYALAPCEDAPCLGADGGGVPMLFACVYGCE